MARITVEDCLQNIDNRFELVLVATRRARQLAAGAPSQLPWNNDKPTVLALREIAAGLVDRSVLEEPSPQEAALEAAAAELEELEARQGGEGVEAAAAPGGEEEAPGEAATAPEAGGEEPPATE